MYLPQYITVKFAAVSCTTFYAHVTFYKILSLKVSLFELQLIISCMTLESCLAFNCFPHSVQEFFITPEINQYWKGAYTAEICADKLLYGCE